MDHCDVLIVGAGPVGATLALELALQGVSFRIIDKSPTRSEHSRALVVHPRTLELLDRHGAVDKLMARGAIARGAVMNINRKLVAMVDMDDLDITDTSFPLPLMVSQAETEKFMEESLAQYGKAVERGYTATSIVQDDNGVTTTLEKPDGTQITIRSKYVVGCDGAHSVVRHSAKDLTFDGDAYPQDFILCDARLRNSNIARDRFTICFGDTGLLAFFPISPHSNDNNEDGLIRLIASGGRSVIKQPPPQPTAPGSLPPQQQQQQEQQQLQHDEQPHEPPTLTHFQSLLDSFAPPGSGTVHSPIWLARFRLHHRGVNSYRSGRLFVAGDAAHIHSPAGGLGMNVGIQDAVNLGWKLASVLKYHDQLTDKAREALLDSYHAERYPVGRALLQGTDRMFSFTAAAHPWVLRVRNAVLPWVVPWLVGVKWIRRRFYNFISGFGTTYSGLLANAGGGTGGSVVVGGGMNTSSSSIKIRGGDRLPDGKVIELGLGRKEWSLHRLCRGASWHLLLFSGTGTGDASDAATAEGLTLAGERVLAVVKSECSLHFFHYVHAEGRGDYSAGQGRYDGELQVATGESGVASTSYADPGGRVHGLLGLDNGHGGFVMVRPDGYVSHIGYLPSLQDFLNEWETKVGI
ncbi:FAD binding domain-containing protein [Pseudoneurospora amorphoporcata]|uniref:FAD binding domain-containing protein n=1 Tax=Pseudoneurospora amorphoporcata TaxID=241081 RepID=A0AAN6SFP1_9PEZI|nr:FAD binding domain-containing protein [Pseudoneurospora amorphoporcata]